MSPPSSQPVPADEPSRLLDELLAAGLLFDTGVEGVYGRHAVFEDVTQRFDALVTRRGADRQPERVHFPPGMSRRHFEKSGYLKSFPQLAGTVHSFCGDDLGHGRLLERVAHGEDWTGEQEATEIVLTPAACYPLYPLIAARGALPPAGALFELQSYCFRHEPSKDPARMQLFRMHEYVCAGSPGQVLEFRALWLERARVLMSDLELPFEIDVANDPFFGRAGQLLGAAQREQALKFELLTPIESLAAPTACLSFNYHQDHFGETWGIRQADGEIAHTACVGFGLERVTLALFRRHGLSPEAWPDRVRAALAF